MPNFARLTVTCTLYTVLCAATPQIHAAGFQVSETGVTGLGLAFAGAGVEGEPADMFHNPAGLMLGDGKLLQAAAHLIAPTAEFFEVGSGNTGGTDDGVDGGVTAAVPNFYYTADGEAGGRFGIGITSPFGLTTEYPADWAGRHHAIKSSLLTLEVNPAVAFRLSDRVNIGGGITLLKAQAELSQALPNNAISTVTGEDTAVGFNLGIVVGGAGGRVGLGYRSKMELEIDGDLTVGGNTVTGANAKLTLPATFYLSAYKKLTERVSILFGARHTGWDEFDELRVKFDNNLPDAVTPHNWHNSNTYSLGIRYQPNTRWTFRGGYARDESPIKNDAHRTPRIPDATRDWLTVGGSYRASEKTRVDFAFAHLFADPVTVSQPGVVFAPGMATPDLEGEYRNSEANIFALQFHFALHR